MPAGLIEKLYYRLPVVAQNCLFSAYSWNINRKRYGGGFSQRLAELELTQWWSKEQIADYQNRQVISLVRHAYETVPFYRRWYDQCGVDVYAIKNVDDLSKLPILTKALVRENQHEMLSEKYKGKHLVKGLTSGTTGTPLNIWLTQDSLAFQWAIWWRHKARFGLSPDDRHLTFGARVPVSPDQRRPPYWRKEYFGSRVYLSTYHISENTVRDIVSYLNGQDFAFYTGYPSAIFSLASLIERHGLELTKTPRWVVTGSDALLPDYEKTIVRVFRSPVTEQYGMTEFAGNMSKCEHGKFHVDFECCHVEGSPRGSDDAHALLITGWGNPAMPFIRYELGDLGVADVAGCDCGRSSPCYAKIEGRLEDYIVTPDGRKLIGMNQVFEYAKNARQMQLFQLSGDVVEFRIVPDSGFGEEDKNALRREFIRRAGSGMEIRFKVVDRVELSDSGKTKAVISKVSV